MIMIVRTFVKSIIIVNYLLIRIHQVHYRRLSVYTFTITTNYQTNKDD
jgi:hypothetical protein